MSRCYLYRGPQSVRAPAYQYEPTTPEWRDCSVEDWLWGVKNSECCLKSII
jgi:hypothetical protein